MRMFIGSLAVTSFGAGLYLKLTSC